MQLGQPRLHGLSRMQSGPQLNILSQKIMNTVPYIFFKVRLTHESITMRIELENQQNKENIKVIRLHWTRVII